MSDHLNQLFLSALSRNLGAIDGTQFCLAVSGGRDSLILAELAYQHLGPSQFVVAHFDHRQRPESYQDRDFVRRWCFERNILFLEGQYRGNSRSEDSLREARYAFLKECLRKHGLSYILTAHHLGDQLETFLMRFVRGTSIQGLSAIPEKREQILRPLLQASPRLLNEYASSQNLQWVEDPSNASPKYFRNRVRHHLVPALLTLSQEYGGEDSFFSRFSELVTELDQLKTKKTLLGSQLLRAHSERTSLWIKCSESQLQLLSSQEQQTLIASLCQELDVSLSSRSLVQRLSEFIRSDTSELHLAGPLFITRSFGVIYFQNRTQRNNWQKACEFQSQSASSHNPWLGVSIETTLDFEQLEWRTPKEGDRHEGKRLKRLHAEEKLPLLERRIVPVLAKRGRNEVVWRYPQATSKVRVEERAE